MTVWDWEYALGTIPRLLRGLWLTFVITLCAAGIALSFGWFLAIIRRTSAKVVNGPATFVLNFIRGTPLPIQLFAIFYILPEYGIVLSIFVTGFLALGIHNACYISEVYRAGIDQIPPGQWDACVALNLSRPRVWFRIMLPQILRTSAPAIGNYVVLMYKETALLVIIGAPVLLGEAQALGNESYRFLEPYTICALLYLIVSYPSSRLIRKWEAKV